MKKFNFTNAEEMLATINVADVDLYNPKTGTYVFHYNLAGSIAVYNDIDLDEAVELEKVAKKNNDYWASSLGPGGKIYDDPDYPGFNRELLTSNLEWCENHYTEEWIATTDVIEYKNNLKKYYVTFKVEGRYVVEVDATNADHARREAAEKAIDVVLDSNNLEVVDEEDIIVEDENGNIIWER